MNNYWPIHTAPAHTSEAKSILLYWESRGWWQGYYAVDDLFSDRPVGWNSPESGWIGFGDACIPANQPKYWHKLPYKPEN